MACRFSLLFFFFDKTSIKTLEKKKNHTEVAILIMKFEEVWFGYQLMLIHVMTWITVMVKQA